MANNYWDGHNWQTNILSSDVPDWDSSSSFDNMEKDEKITYCKVLAKALKTGDWYDVFGAKQAEIIFKGDEYIAQKDIYWIGEQATFRVYEIIHY